MAGCTAGHTAWANHELRIAARRATLRPSRPNWNSWLLHLTRFPRESRRPSQPSRRPPSPTSRRPPACPPVLCHAIRSPITAPNIAWPRLGRSSASKHPVCRACTERALPADSPCRLRPFGRLFGRLKGSSPAHCAERRDTVDGRIKRPVMSTACSPSFARFVSCSCSLPIHPFSITSPQYAQLLKERERKSVDA